MPRHFIFVVAVATTVACAAAFGSGTSSSSPRQQFPTHQRAKSASLFPSPSNDATGFTIAKRRRRPEVRMNVGESGEEESSASESKPIASASLEADDSVEAATTPTTRMVETNNSEKGGKRWSASSLVIVPTLIFKFTIVLLVKFATDIVVYPILWTYRLARRGKQKVLGMFGAAEEVKLNGEAKSTEMTENGGEGGGGDGTPPAPAL